MMKKQNKLKNQENLWNPLLRSVSSREGMVVFQSSLLKLLAMEDCNPEESVI
jgi:hypothetical protein